MVSEYITVRICVNDIFFMKMTSELKLRFYAKLKNLGISKDKFFRMCFLSFLEDDNNILDIVNNKKYNELVAEENKEKVEWQRNLKKDKLEKRKKVYDIEYFLIDEE